MKYAFSYLFLLSAGSYLFKVITVSISYRYYLQLHTLTEIVVYSFIT